MKIIKTKKPGALTDREKRYLKALRGLEMKNEQFTHRKLCEKFGWSSVQASFDFMRRLVAKGHIAQHGERLAFVVGPVLTAKGRQAVERKRAA